MAKYLVNEIRTDPDYAKTKKQFSDNPNVDYHTGTKVLGTNLIRWRYNDPEYASGHRNRDKFYAQLGGITLLAVVPRTVQCPHKARHLPNLCYLHIKWNSHSSKCSRYSKFHKRLICLV